MSNPPSQTAQDLAILLCWCNTASSLLGLGAAALTLDSADPTGNLTFGVLPVSRL